MRGNHSARQGAGLGSRSIPACAGEPIPHDTVDSAFTVYPRVCGGTAHGVHDATDYKGLSPRVRGNHFRTRAPVSTVGSIPACAGEPPERSGPPDRRTVYPRVCGGTVHGDRDRDAGPGLSPRVRGNRPKMRIVAPPPGSIPACAGEPCPMDSTRNRSGVYPRVCGGTPPATRI